MPRSDLPMIWDADFMLGQPGADRTDSYVLGEINVSSVSRSPMRRRQRSRAELPQSKEWHIEGETHLANPGCI
jgi:uncharacterized protein DUF6815